MASPIKGKPSVESEGPPDADYPSDISHEPSDAEYDGDATSASNANFDRVTGVLPDGSRFGVPETMDVMSTLTSLRALMKLPTQIWFLGILAIELTLYFFLQGYIGRWFFVLQFFFWRAAYNVGLGYILHMQSNHKSLTSFYVRHFEHGSAFSRKFLEDSVLFRNPNEPKYKISAFPREFNAWMLYRYIVNIILANDVASYFVLVTTSWRSPNFSDPIDIVRYAVGIALIVFGLWSKTDAHRVLGDYAWYWGDFFFLLDKNLVFDGIFQMFPHPMYTVGYAFMYGFTLMAKSYTVFYCSIAGHLAQIAFLAFVENPHIDKTYNALRAPSEEERLRDEILYHDTQGYLDRRELIVFRNFTFYRSGDFALLCLLIYATVSGFLIDLGIPFYMIQYVAWRLLLNCGLGYVLRSQSMDKRWTQKYFKTNVEAFEHWKRVYNTVVTMTNYSYFICAVRCFQWTSPYMMKSDFRLAVLVVGLLLVAIHVYVAYCCFESIGEFGYFYGDFFVEDIPSRLNYSGIYRYLNNPDSTLGFAGYYGLALCSGNIIMFPLAVFSHVSGKLFEVFVEDPHMQRKYGEQVRVEGGLRSEIKTKATQLRQQLRTKRQVAKRQYEERLNVLKVEMEKQRERYERLKDTIAKTRDAAPGKKHR